MLYNSYSALVKNIFLMNKICIFNLLNIKVILSKYVISVLEITSNILQLKTV